MPARRWTPEQRAKQARLIRQWKPWEKSTGPNTPEGKVIASKNAFQCSLREVLRESVRVNKQLMLYYRALVYGEDIALFPPPDVRASRRRMMALVEDSKNESVFSEPDD